MNQCALKSTLDVNSKRYTILSRVVVFYLYGYNNRKIDKNKTDKNFSQFIIIL